MSRYRLPALLSLLASVLATLTFPVTGAQASISPLATLQSQFGAYLRLTTAAAAEVRVDVAGLGSFSYHPSYTQPPASNEKLFTAAAALGELGPGFTFRTGVYRSGSMTGSTLVGNLVIVAAGDPTLSSGTLAGLAAAVRSAGIQWVHGEVLLEDTVLGPWGPAAGWRPDFVPTEVGPVTGFSINENGYRTDTAFLANPDAANLGAWRWFLKQAGVVATGSNGLTTVNPATLLPVTAHTSAPLSSIVAGMLTYSDNFYAEDLLERLGDRYGAGTRGNGLTAVQSEAAALRVATGRMYDGSGLSYYDLESPDSIVAWLESVTAQPFFPAFFAGLPVSCRTGTLVGRLCGAWISERIRAKTGTLTGIRTLSGYALTKSGRHVTFSVLLSGISDMAAAQWYLDKAVAQIALFTG